MRDRWTYVADGRAPKPYVHPLRAPGGRLLSVCAPPDHPWHRGLWFAIKYVDGDNFWEEEPGGAGFGVQRVVGDGDGDGGDRIEWVRPSGAVALVETRRVEHVAIDGDGEVGDGERAGGRAYAIDWSSTLAAASADVVLDRTPYTTWGGYGGLTLRGPTDWADTRVLLDDGSEHRRPEGVPSRWADLSGPDAGVAFLDHPSNPRHPVPWYGASRSRVYGEGWSNFLNGAFLFHEPLVLPVRGEPLRFRYRVVVHDGAWDVARASAAWDAFAAAEVPSS